jgi:hypothetical protein
MPKPTIHDCVVFNGIQETLNGEQLALFTDMDTKSSFVVEVNSCVLCKLASMRLRYDRHSEAPPLGATAAAITAGIQGHK